MPNSQLAHADSCAPNRSKASQRSPHASILSCPYTVPSRHSPNAWLNRRTSYRSKLRLLILTAPCTTRKGSSSVMGFSLSRYPRGRTLCLLLRLMWSAMRAFCLKLSSHRLRRFCKSLSLTLNSWQCAWESKIMAANWFCWIHFSKLFNWKVIMMNPLAIWVDLPLHHTVIINGLNALALKVARDQNRHNLCTYSLGAWTQSHRTVSQTPGNNQFLRN